MIKRKKYGLRKKDLGINWTVNWLAVDDYNGKVFAYHNDPGGSVANDTGGRCYSIHGNCNPETFVKVTMPWCH